ncbi:glycosyltransferase [Mesobacillus maritimus]|uniref:glycosyltransferase n=1 Tax=Mesobacillus maritimus TaxID=1643336 RepID=UPI00203C0E1F|nr:glycosyltransferase [Mesobacillus maritimus]MCM3668082.1 glycosyltransferase [Mesobacillus maritimus]
MRNTTPVFVFKSLDVVRGGLTKAVLTRANMLARHYEEVVFLTLKFQPNFKEIKEELYQSGKLDPRVTVKNFYDEMMSRAVSADPKRMAPNDIEEEGYAVLKDTEQEKNPSYRYYKNGQYVKYKRFNENGRLIFTDYMDKSRYRTQRDEYDESGYLVCSQFMDYEKNAPRLKSYYRQDGQCFLTVWMNPDSKKEGKAILFTDEPKEFNSLNDLYRYWIQNELTLYSLPLVMSDSRATDGIVLKLKISNGKKIAILHNNHLDKPYSQIENVKKTWTTLFNGISKYDSVVFLTNEQKKDVAEKFGMISSYTVIPHAAKQVDLQRVQNDYNPHVAVTLARYDNQKRLDEAVRAFKYVVDNIPDAEFHIYGFGPKEDELKRLISSLDLEKNVLLKGFTDNPTYTYQTASCSILTSDYEGFGMVLTESLAAGTPVVAYDIKYGPRDIVRDGVDGYLVDKGNKKELAKKIVKIMNDDNLRMKMSKKALEVTERFSEHNYESQWLNLFNQLENEKNDLGNKTIRSGHMNLRENAPSYTMHSPVQVDGIPTIREKNIESIKTKFKRLINKLQ